MRQRVLWQVDAQGYRECTWASECGRSVAKTRCARFSVSREVSTNQVDLQLMGLDPPLVQDELGRWRSVPPEKVGIAASRDVDEPVLLSLWMVEASSRTCSHYVLLRKSARSV